MPGYVYYILVACALAAVVLFINRYDPKINRIKNRVPLSDEDFAKTFPPQQKEIAIMVRRLIAEELGFDRTKILPTDNLPEDLGVGTWLDDMASVEIAAEIEKTFATKLPECEAARAQTVAEVVSLVAELPAKRAREIATMIPPRHDL